MILSVNTNYVCYGTLIIFYLFLFFYGSLCSFSAVFIQSHYFLELSQSTAIFAKSAAMLGNVEEHTALSRALSQLAETEEKIELLHKEQSEADFFLMAELMKDYVALMGAVKVIAVIVI